MSRIKIIKILKKKNPKLSHSDLNTIVDSFSEDFIITLKKACNIDLRDFGTFFLKTTKEKFSARNPKTGELLYIPEKKKIRFKASKKLKEAINQ